MLPRRWPSWTLHRNPIGETRAHAGVDFRGHEGFVEPQRGREIVVARFLDEDGALRRGANQPHRILFRKTEVDEKLWIVDLDIERLGADRRLERQREMERKDGFLGIV